MHLAISSGSGDAGGLGGGLTRTAKIGVAVRGLQPRQYEADLASTRAESFISRTASSGRTTSGFAEKVQDVVVNRQIHHLGTVKFFSEGSSQCFGSYDVKANQKLTCLAYSSGGGSQPQIHCALVSRRTFPFIFGGGAVTTPRLGLCQLKNETIPQATSVSDLSSLACAGPRAVRRPRTEVSQYPLGGPELALLKHLAGIRPFRDKVSGSNTCSVLNLSRWHARRCLCGEPVGSFPLQIQNFEEDSDRHDRNPELT